MEALRLVPYGSTFAICWQKIPVIILTDRQISFFVVQFRFDSLGNCIFVFVSFSLVYMASAVSFFLKNGGICFASFAKLFCLSYNCGSECVIRGFFSILITQLALFLNSDVLKLCFRVLIQMACPLVLYIKQFHHYI